jgi:hypothetical protein
VIGHKNESVILTGAVEAVWDEEGMWYVRFVTEASYLAPKYFGKVMW